MNLNLQNRSVESNVFSGIQKEYVTLGTAMKSITVCSW